ncbi:hypothetical protein CFR80_06060 [Komagataeibacter oboediens]|uniref:Uncharacterized protein n=1 Tax=Komagataeibacter oboediens TaxID=65958 RepID=A0A318R829_9PROT|nr:hypothetical protein CFR80_06060 [Komagataeibacter oboediens]
MAAGPLYVRQARADRALPLLAQTAPVSGWFPAHAAGHALSGSGRGLRRAAMRFSGPRVYVRLLPGRAGVVRPARHHGRPLQ